MNEKDSESFESKSKVMARLAVLQRLRDEAREGSRSSMLKSIDQLIELERKMLSHLRDENAEHGA